jgi:uncharacterized protein YbjT (DUF2867 family)
MVKIAIAGGSGGKHFISLQILDLLMFRVKPEVAREVIDALLAAKKHEITVLSRSAQKDIIPDVSWRVVNYKDKNELVEALRGTHTVLSFIQLLADAENTSQKNLIDAAIIAGVKRFAPSEWGR